VKSIDSVQDIQDTARGAVFLGAGGGGDPYVGELFLRSQLSAGRRPRIESLEELADDAFVISVAGVGAPTVLVEHLVSAPTFVRLLEESEVVYGQRVDALVSAEIGGANCMFPLALGAMKGLPVLDADGIGRAVPHLDMTTFNVYGCLATPSVLVDDSGNTVVVRTTSNRTAEHVIRSVASALGATIYGSFYPMTGRQAKQFAVAGTLSLALEIGRIIRSAREHSSDAVRGLLAGLRELPDPRPCRLLFEGKIADVLHETRDGWHFGRAVLESTSSGTRSELIIEIQNEYLVARRDGRTVAIVPDLICVLDRESAEPLTAEMLRYGQRVAVVAYAAPPVLRRPESLAVVGPRQFGLKEDFTALEALIAEEE
jgi:uncharacterized protein